LLKKLVTAILCFTVIFSLSSAATFAQAIDINQYESERTKKIQLLFDERDGIISSYEIGSEKKLLKNQKELEKLGVEFLLPQQVQIQFGDDSAVAKLLATDLITPYVSAPNKNNIVWTTYRQNHVANGITHEVQHLIARSNTLNSSLKDTVTASLTYNNTYVAATTNLLTLIAKEGTTTISPITNAAITIYDAIKSFIASFNKTTVVKNVEISYKTDYYTEINFMYVKLKSQSDDDQKLAFVSNSVRGDTRYDISQFEYGPDGATTGTADPITGKREWKYQGRGFLSNAQAVLSYRDSSQPKIGLVGSVEIMGMDNKRIHRIAPAYYTVPGLVN